MGIVQTWDTHVDNWGKLKNRLLPWLDQALAALVDDLESLGLWDQTFVVVAGEFGRTPKVSTLPGEKIPGRDHWARVYSGLFAGAGVVGGRVIGRSDRGGARPVSDAVHAVRHRRDHLPRARRRSRERDPRHPEPPVARLYRHADGCPLPEQVRRDAPRARVEQGVLRRADAPRPAPRRRARPARAVARGLVAGRGRAPEVAHRRVRLGEALHPALPVGFAEPDRHVRPEAGRARRGARRAGVDPDRAARRAHRRSAAANSETPRPRHGAPLADAQRPDPRHSVRVHRGADDRPATGRQRARPAALAVRRVGGGLPRRPRRPEGRRRCRGTTGCRSRSARSAGRRGPARTAGSSARPTTPCGPVPGVGHARRPARLRRPQDADEDRRRSLRGHSSHRPVRDGEARRHDHPRPAQRPRVAARPTRRGPPHERLPHRGHAVRPAPRAGPCRAHFR